MTPYRYESRDVTMRPIVKINIAIAILVAAVLGGLAPYYWHDAAGRPPNVPTQEPGALFLKEEHPGSAAQNP